MNDDLRTRRGDYERGSLDDGTLAADPFAQFGVWLDEALATPQIVEAHAMSLSTVGDDGRPAARMVLLRGWDARGFIFYTNYDSRKGHDLAAHPNAALLFWWGELQRQIRIEGSVERVSVEESDAYFAGRPRGHRLNAWASPQSKVIDAAQLVAAMAAAAEHYPGDVPRPPHWGGYRVAPDQFEFWQGRPDRMHDRIAFLRAATGWVTVRLAP
jgi:pyridoxamine 5'-phosphate oxidase